MITQIIQIPDKEIVNRYKKIYSDFPDYLEDNQRVIEFRELNKNELSEFIKYSRSFPGENTYISEEKSRALIFIQSGLDEFIQNTESELIRNEVKDTINKFRNYNKTSFKLGEKAFNFEKCYVMGILNVTPDSFSDGGKYLKKDSALKKAFTFLDEGADILDVGGESTRPGAGPVTVSEEIERVIPIIRELKKEKPDAVISVDTTKYEVAKQALDLGAEIINDISGLTYSEGFPELAKEFDAALVIMHIKGNPKNMQNEPIYVDPVTEIYDFLSKKVKLAEQAGANKIIVDPGIGFGKRVEDNFEIIKRLNDLRSIGHPILIGLSKKGFIGKTLNLEMNEREIPTSVLEGISIFNGASIIRTHNVKNAVSTVNLINRMV